MGVVTTEESVRARLAFLLGLDPRQLTNTQVQRFKAYEAERELLTRADELKRAIEARPTPGSGWRRLRLMLGEPEYTREQIERWLQSRLDYLPERLQKERDDVRHHSTD